MSGSGDARLDAVKETWPGRQRFGRVTGRQPSGSGPAGNFGTYFVRDDESGQAYTFDYADIVTEGFRTIRTGARYHHEIRVISNFDETLGSASPDLLREMIWGSLSG